MPQRILLLTGRAEAGLLVPVLSRSRVEVLHVQSCEEIAAALQSGASASRLLAFCTAVIVPRELLSRFPGPSYNIHPGPPGYPGRHPESWGAYDGARRFGATLHEMAPRVDEGPIVDVEWFDMPDGAGQLDFGTASFKASIGLLGRWIPHLFGRNEALPRSDHAWHGPKRTHAQLEAMCRVPADIDAAEFERRRRAFAQPVGSRMTVILHGLEFNLTTETEAPLLTLRDTPI